MPVLIFQHQFQASENAPPPQRIVSLVPSQTELLASVGLDDSIMGITKYCIYPQHWQQQKAIVGGTKKVDIELVQSLQPDLIIANKEENVKEQIEALSQICPVYVSDVADLNGALKMILQVGMLVGSLMQAESLVHEIVLAFEKLQQSVAGPANNPLSVAYLIWRKPYMAAGGNTFINDMLQQCGLQNVFAHQQRYPAVRIEDIQQAAPQVLLLSSEPFPFRQKHIAELQAHLPQTNILLANGEMFSWYGSRLLQAPAYFSSLLASL